MIQFTRHDPNEEGTHETLTLVRLDNGGLAVQIETGTPETWKRDPNDRAFVGLYDLDGDQLQLGNESWEIADEQGLSADERVRLATELDVEIDVNFVAAMRDALMRSWESGTSICECID